jgi:hypothetical protein
LSGRSQRGVRIAYGQQPTLTDFLDKIVGPDFKLSVCDTNDPLEEGAKFTYNVFDFEADGDRNVVPKEMILKQSDLAFAADDRENIAIWPVIVFKALDGILQDRNFQESTLLRNEEEVSELFHCGDERKYLCYASDLITRLMGIELESTRRIMEDTKSDQVSITDIFNHAADGPTIVFKNKALTYIVRGVDGKADGDNTFKALWLDMQKSGGDDEMKYRIDKFEEKSGIKFKAIKGQHHSDFLFFKSEEHADVHIVHPFNGRRKPVKV